LIKKVLGKAVRTPFFASFVTLLEHLEPERANTLRILTYHRVAPVDEQPNLSPPLLSATPESFDAQMHHLARHYCPISMQDLLDYYQNGTRLPKRAAMVTFDDAYCDFATHAWPILQRYQIPVTLFVPTAYPDQPDRFFWWDRLYHAIKDTDQQFLETETGAISLETPEQRTVAFKHLREYVKTIPHVQAQAWLDEVYKQLHAPPHIHNVLTWAELRQLYHEGVTMGAHTRTHPMVHRITLQEARDEAVGAYYDLQNQLGEVPPIFAYPSGGFSDEVVQMLDQEGFVLAFTTVKGVNDLKTADRLRLRRINVGRLAAPAVVRAKMLPHAVAQN
jgi:peptidoglycan/xylan/chitin deacetylase (PgdA/CDA1 family)